MNQEYISKLKLGIIPESRVNLNIEMTKITNREQLLLNGGLVVNLTDSKISPDGIELNTTVKGKNMESYAFGKESRAALAYDKNSAYLAMYIKKDNNGLSLVLTPELCAHLFQEDARGCCDTLHITGYRAIPNDIIISPTSSPIVAARADEDSVALMSAILRGELPITPESLVALVNTTAQAIVGSIFIELTNLNKIINSLTEKPPVLVLPPEPTIIVPEKKKRGRPRKDEHNRNSR